MCLKNKQFQTESSKMRGMKNARLPRPMTSKQSRFIDEYMVDMNGAAAAERAGYSAKTSRAIACELLTKPDILAQVQARGAALAQELAITREGVVQGLLEAFEMAKTDRQPGAMISAMVALAKLLGFYAVETVRVELTPAQLAVRNRYQSMTDAELMAVMAGKAV
jgi:hypothetical protein